MARLYTPGVIPEEYDAVILREQLTQIAASIRQLESPAVRITISNTAPSKPQAGDVYHADGTNWNPGSGAGLYAYISGSWTKL